jgi:hypothetical protein
LCGYRISAAVPGHRQTSFEAAGLVREPLAAISRIISRLAGARGNVIDHDSADVVSESQAIELSARATQYHSLVEVRILKNHPNFAA